MSRVKIEGNATGSGTLTISAPATNTDRSLTLPDGAGEILTDASTLSSSNLSGALPAIDGSALTGITTGKVLQIVTQQWTDVQTTNSTSEVAVTNGSASITPSSTSSKVLVLVSIQLDHRGSYAGFISLYQDSTKIEPQTSYGNRNAPFMMIRHGTNEGIMIETNQYMASPSTTSSVTYSLKAYVNNSAYVMGINRTETDPDNEHGARGFSTITLMEIGA